MRIATERLDAIGLRKSVRPVRFSFEPLSRGSLARNSSVDRRPSDRAFRVLVGSGRGCALTDMATPTVLIPLRGRVKLVEGQGARMLHVGQLYVGEGGNHAQAIGGSESLWIVFAAPAAVWRQFVDAISEESLAAPVLLPAIYTASRAIRRTATRLAREIRRQDPCGRSQEIATTLRFVSLLLDLQSAFDPLISRCPGRTLAQRRGVFLRLQRVRNHMELSSDLNLHIAGLARLANYSPCHFVRTFNLAYGETPHAVLIEQRLKRALRLVNDTELSITEVARASGFEDRCAFARSFKRRFGETATAVRERSQSCGALCE